MQKNKKIGLKESIAKTLQLPDDLAFRESILTLIGNNELLIENYKKIMEYTSHNLLIQTEHCKLRIRGERIEICYYTSDEMKVTGCFSSILYEK